MALGMGNHVALISLLNCILCICRIRGHVDCSLGGASCKSCMVAYPFCYWCDTMSGGSCQTFVSDEISEAECPSHWSYKACLVDESSEYETGKQGEDQMLKLILEEDQSKNADDLGHPNNIAPVSAEPSSKSGSMKELLRKLLLLKLLQKVRSTFEENRPGGMASAETRYNPSPEASKSSETYGLSEPGSLEYLEKVVNMLEIQKTKFTSSSELVSADRTVLPKGPENKSLSIEPTLPLKWTPDTQPMVVSTTESSYKSEELNLEYEDKKSRVDLRISITMPLTSGTATRAPVTLSLNESLPDTYKLLTRNYCELYDSKGACNMDNNCTWCNTVDSCIGRSSDDYATCVGNQKRVSKLDYGLDHCLDLKSCGDCVSDDKCYWCATSKSCHSYPFFGYVPHSCASGNWFYKQCDVQLAVIVVILPLFIVLLAMLTFYFCLKYCYYRKKILRVPLFERPGVFDYRKNKKVYFVNPNDDEGDADLKAEQLRKKYRLPVEREPLIDPNT